jgi:hypothetical protein
MVTKVIQAGRLDDDSSAKPVQVNSKPCKQYNEKIVTPHLN